jgi:hypothetical protein
MANTAYIDSYFNKELPASEQAGFEQKIISDPDFAEEVLLYCGALKLAKELSIAEKKQRFRELYNTNKEQQQPAKIRTLRKWWPYVAAAAVVTGILFWSLGYFTDASIQQKATAYMKEHFTTISVQMSSGGDMQQAKELFNLNKLPDALTILNRILAAGTGSDEAKELAGIVNLRLENYDQAIVHFSDLEKSTSYTNPGKFYHALTLIKRNQAGDNDKAKLLLQQVVNENLDEKETAARWLKDL